MTLLWPGFLFALLLIPVAIGIYIWILRRRRRFAVRFSSLSLMRDALPRRSWLRRHLPFVLFLLALTSLVAALARPVNRVRIPADQATIILALDVSRSMRQMDIWPSRIEAAKEAALSFIDSQEPGIQIGIVAFSGFAQTIMPPTTDQEALKSAVESLTLGRGTAIGSGLLEAMELINEVDDLLPLGTNGDALGGSQRLPGTYSPYIVVLLTDGVNTTGPRPMEAAQQAMIFGVRTYTIGFGAPIDNGSLDQENSQPGAGGQDGFGGNNQGGEGQFRGFFRRGLDEATLREVAAITGGEYYAAESANELKSVFSSLPTNLITRLETTEISVFFAALGALFAGIAIVLSLLWHPLP